MSTKTMKILTFVATALLVVALGATTVLGVTVNGVELTPNQIIGGAVNGTEGITDFGKRVIGILQTVGIVLSVVILVVLGLKYMMGSAEEKADYKKTMMPYIVGAVFIFLAPTIANMIYSLVKT